MQPRDSDARPVLVRLPTDRPKGDQQGNVDRPADLRGHTSWLLPYGEHAGGDA